MSVGILHGMSLRCHVWITLTEQALDNTILATAIPRITDQFNSLADVGWYGSGT
jgi:hypothetical protein